jgi:hypothetical protein
LNVTPASARLLVKIRNSAAHSAFVWGSVHKNKTERLDDAMAQVRRQIDEAMILVDALTVETLRGHQLKKGNAVSAPPMEETN